MAEQINFISFNVRGLGEVRKRRKVFDWLKKAQHNIIMIQEAHSTSDDVNKWPKFLPGHYIFSHGTSASRGVVTVIRNLDFVIHNVSCDTEGRIVIISIDIDKKPFLLINSYAPNFENSHSSFMEQLLKKITDLQVDPEREIIWGGDHNFVLNADLDRSGVKSKIWNKSASIFDDMFTEFDLIDIWRIRNPTMKRFTWRRLRPVLTQSRLDYFLVSSSLQTIVKESDIIPNVLSDHSAITLSISDKRIRLGSSLWKFNNSLIYDPEYIELIKSGIQQWTTEYHNLNSKQGLWEYIKFKIKGTTMEFSKKKAKERKIRIDTLESKLRDIDIELSTNNSDDLRTQYENIHAELRIEYDHITEGACIRSRADWYEFGEKNTKYFLGLEKHNAKKSLITQLFDTSNNLLTVPSEIQNHILKFYSDLYSTRIRDWDESTGDYFFNRDYFPTLNAREQSLCEGPITLQEAYLVLKGMNKNRSPGNDGLTVEFYQCFWGDLGHHVVNSLNEAYDRGEMSPSQTQGVIT